VGVRPTRVARLRARRARRLAVLWACALTAVVVSRPGIVPGFGSDAASKGVARADTRPGVQGSTTSRSASRERGVAASPVAAVGLADASMFNVDTASEVRSVERGVGVWVAARRGPGALGALKLSAEAAPSAIPPSWLVLHRPIAVTVEVQGKDLDVMTNAATVRQLLSAMGIEPDGDDRVAPPLQTPLHPIHPVRFDRVDVRVLTVGSAVDYAVHSTTTTSLPAGQVRVVTPGARGTVERTYRVRLVNGREVSRTLLSERTSRAVVDEVREVGAAPKPPPPPPPPPQRTSHTETGQATWYDTGHSGFTAAHPTLPFGTRVTVTNLASGKTVTVVINDRGPFGGRIIDLSHDAFAVLAPPLQGVCQVRLTW
jgi:hypothetical protein